MAERHKIFNSAVREFAHKNEIGIIELTDFIKSDEDYTTCINHFSRRVYSDLAQRIVNVSNDILKNKYLSFKNISS